MSEEVYKKRYVVRRKQGVGGTSGNRYRYFIDYRSEDAALFTDILASPERAYQFKRMGKAINMRQALEALDFMHRKYKSKGELWMVEEVFIEANESKD